MALTIKNLEHLDGKSVKYSTLTSQFPEIFVNRKKNTGELIVTTDTDQKYGMHHIYAGGEHIAGGYGFATIVTRDDLCYVQETYQGVFKYFDNGYTYLSNAYSYLNKYVNDAYSYLNQSIKFNSYLNNSVDSNYNELTDINGITYIFTFSDTLGNNDGILRVVPKNNTNLSVIGKPTILVDVNQQTNSFQIDNKTNKYYKRFNVQLNITNVQNIKGEYITHSNIDAFIFNNLNTNTNYNNNIILDNGINIDDLLNNAKTILDNNTNDSFPIYIEHNVDTEFIVKYKVKTQNQQQYSEYQSTPIQYIWVKPIYIFESSNKLFTDDILSISDETLYGANTHIELTNYKTNNYINDNSITNVTRTLTFTHDFIIPDNFINDIIVDTTSTVNDVNNQVKKSHIYICLPNYIKNPIFYLSEDTTRRGAYEGGITKAQYVEYINNSKLLQQVSCLQDYTIYRSDDYYIEKTIRIDIIYTV